MPPSCPKLEDGALPPQIGLSSQYTEEWGMGQLTPSAVNSQLVSQDSRDGKLFQDGLVSRPSSPTPPNPSSRPRTHYATQSDWESKKFVIEGLYVHQNLPLKDVMDIMERRHNFRATKRMYKTQFSRWEWRKYGNSTSSSSLGQTGPASVHKTCLRQRSSRVKALLNESTSTGLVNEALLHLQELIHMYVERDLQQKTITKYEWIGLGTSQPSIANDMQAALERFNQRDHLNGGKILRRAFLKVEFALQDLSFNAAFDLLIVPVCYLLIHKQPDLVQAYISHVSSMATLRAGSSALTRLASSLCVLARHHLRQLYQFVGAALELRTNTAARHVGERTRSGLGLRQLEMSNQVRLGVRSVDWQWEVQNLVGEFEALMEEARTSSADADDIVFILEDEVGLLQMRSNTYLDGFVQSSREMLQCLAKRYEMTATDILGDGWAQLHVDLYLDCVVRVVLYHLDKDKEFDLASDMLLDLYRFSPDERDLWISTRLNYISRIEEGLRRLGKDGEADDLVRLWQETARFEMLSREVEQWESDIADGVDNFDDGKIPDNNENK